MLLLKPIADEKAIYSERMGSDANADLVRAVESMSDDVFAVIYGDILIGYCQCIQGSNAYICLQLFEGYRTDALLEGAIRLAEEKVDSRISYH